jgi:hypothetical protein
MIESELIERIKQGKNFERSSKGHFLYWLTIDGVKVGVAMATRKPPYDTAALNKKDTELVTTAKANGKIANAFVVMVEWPDGPGGDQIVTDVADAEAVHAKYKDKPTRTGMFGEFWTIGNLNDDDDDDPF